MKKKVLLVLLLVVCFSSQLSSETLDCWKSFELGKIAAKEEYKACGWYWLGIGAGITEILFSLFLADFVDYAVGFVAAAGATNVAGIVLSRAFPQPSRIVPSSVDIDLECYRKGYKERTTSKNYGAFVLGQLAPVLVWFAGVAYMAAVNGML